MLVYFTRKMMKILVLLAVSLAVVSSQAVEDVIKNMLVKKGENVTLECGTKEVGRCTLLNSTAGIVVDRHEAKKERAKILNNESCIIIIQNVHLKDTDLYDCKTTNYDFKFQITVFEPPNEPELTYNGDVIANDSRNVVDVHGDGTVQIECRSYGGYPSANITWFVDNELQSTSQTADKVENGLINTRSLLFVRFDDLGYSIDGPQHPEKEVRCEVDHLAYNSSTRRVLVGFFGKQYATNYVALEMDQPHNTILDGPRNVICMANGLPTPTDFKIMRETDEKDKYEVVAVNSTYTVTTPGIYLCEARNENQAGEKMGDYVASKSVHFMDPEKAGQRTAEGNVASIVGIVLGTIIAIAIVVVVVAFLYRREKLCFAPSTRNQQFSPSPGNVENGVKNVYDNEMTNTEKDQKKDGVKGDQNENTKPKEVVYAQLDLTQKTNNGNSRPKSPEEKTEYAQLTFQPKENQV